MTNRQNTEQDRTINYIDIYLFWPIVQRGKTLVIIYAAPCITTVETMECAKPRKRQGPLNPSKPRPRYSLRVSVEDPPCGMFTTAAMMMTFTLSLSRRRESPAAPPALPGWASQGSYRPSPLGSRVTLSQGCRHAGVVEETGLCIFGLLFGLCGSWKKRANS